MSTVHRIIPLYNRPYLTTSPRDLWNTRWSVTAGYHLRWAFYTPVRNYCWRKERGGGGGTWLVAAAAAPFLVNCLLHISWWSLVVKGTIDHAYWNLLFVYPLVSLALQDFMGTVVFASRRRATTLLHKLANMVLLWTGFLFITEPMSAAQGLHSSLRHVCRANLGLPLDN